MHDEHTGGAHRAFMRVQRGPHTCLPSHRQAGRVSAVVPSDEALERTVAKAFIYDPRIESPESIEVHVRNDRVTLTGEVENLPAKRAAEKDALNTVGVGRVKNLVKVCPSENHEDSTIADKVREGLARDPYVDRYQIDVLARNGEIRLTGAVENEFEKVQAEAVASRVGEVVKVVNNFDALAEEQAKQDWEILQDIEQEIWWSPYVESKDIAVSVDDGIATLRGTVETWLERRRAELNAYDGGARAVRNLVKVAGVDPGVLGRR